MSSLNMNPQTSMQIISPAIISHSATFTIIPLVIGFHICFFRKNETVLTRPAIANSAKSADITTKPIFCIKPSLYIQVLCTQKRSYPPSMVIYNANKVPIIRNEPISVLCDACPITQQQNSKSKLYQHFTENFLRFFSILDACILDPRLS